MQCLLKRTVPTVNVTKLSETFSFWSGVVCHCIRLAKRLHYYLKFQKSGKCHCDNYEVNSVNTAFMLKSNPRNVPWHLCHIEKWCLLANADRDFIVIFFLTTLHFFPPEPYTFGTPAVPTGWLHSNEQLIAPTTAGPSVDCMFLCVAKAKMLYEYEAGLHLGKKNMCIFLQYYL